jgi:hypothetical protein
MIRLANQSKESIMKKILLSLSLSVILLSCGGEEKPLVTLEDAFNNENCVEHLVFLSSNSKEPFRGIGIYDIRTVLDENGKSDISRDLLKELNNKKYKDVIKVLVDKHIESKKPPTNDKYEGIKLEYEQLGTWEIKNKMNKNFNHTYEIYFTDKDVVGVQIWSKEIKFESLTREKLGETSARYVVKDSKFGEYYAIGETKNMLLYDKDGELTSAGWSASFVKE